MNFKDALRKVYKISKNKEQLSDPFIVYSRVSDLIGNSYNDKKKAWLFFQVTKEVNLFCLAIEYGETMKNKIIRMYDNVEKLLPKEKFVNLVDFVFSIVFPKNKINHVNQGNTQGISKTKKAPQEIKNETPLPKTYAANYGSEHTGRFWVVGGVCVIILAAVLGGLFFGKYISWNVWQWIIGVGGGILLTILCAVIIGFVVEIFCVEYFVGGTVILYLFSIVNFVLRCIFGFGYEVIFLCYCAILLISGIGLAIATFIEEERGYGTAQIVADILTVIFLVVGLLIL